MNFKCPFLDLSLLADDRASPLRTLAERYRNRISYSASGLIPVPRKALGLKPLTLVRSPTDWPGFFLAAVAPSGRLRAEMFPLNRAGTDGDLGTARAGRFQ
jgi:hypothetical protein